MKKLTKEFAEFINKGNVFELATGVVLGTALKSVIDAIVKYFIMPIIGLVSPKKTFENWQIYQFKIGLILEAVINFIIIGLVVFLILKILSFLKKYVKKDQEIIKVEEKQEELLLEEIRDLLQEQNKHLKSK